MPLKIKKTVQQMVDEANAEIETVPVEEAMKLVGQPGITFIDIRDPRELWRDGTIPGAINVTRGAGAWRSALATKTAQDMGLSPVAHLEGGLGAWKKAGGPVQKVEPKK